MSLTSVLEAFAIGASLATLAVIVVAMGVLLAVEIHVYLRSRE